MHRNEAAAEQGALLRDKRGLMKGEGCTIRVAEQLEDIIRRGEPVMGLGYRRHCGGGAAQDDGQDAARERNGRA